MHEKARCTSSAGAHEKPDAVRSMYELLRCHGRLLRNLGRVGWLIRVGAATHAQQSTAADERGEKGLQHAERELEDEIYVIDVFA